MDTVKERKNGRMRTFYLDNKTIDQIEELATRLKLTRVAVVESAIAEYYKRKTRTGPKKT